MFRFLKKGSVEYVESIALGHCDFLLHAFCTRRGGVSEGYFTSLNFSTREGDRGENVLQNWEIIAQAFNLHVDQFFTVNQIHGDTILIVDHNGTASFNHQPRQYDAIITDRPGLAIGIKTADCVPVFLVDKAKRIIGVVHAGWRGTSLNIAAKTVRAFVGTFSSLPADLIAAIGPAIGPCCYQVDETVIKAVMIDGMVASAFTSCIEKGKWMLDLSMVNRYQLLQEGVPPENVFSMGICTSCQKKQFYSHRGEGGRTGRQINFMMLKEGGAD